MSIIKFFFMKLLDSWNMLKFLYEGFYASWWNVIGVNCIACWVRLKCSWVFLLFQYFEKVVKFHLTNLITAIKLIFGFCLSDTMFTFFEIICDMLVVLIYFISVAVCMLFTAWKVSKYGVFSGQYFPVFGLNTDQKKFHI